MITRRSGAPTRRLAVQVSGEVRAVMARFSLQQADLAVILGVTQAQVLRKLRCVHPFTLDEVELLADYFSTTPPVLMGYATEPRPARPVPPAEWHTLRGLNPERE